MEHFKYITTPLGIMGIREENGEITDLYFDGRDDGGRTSSAVLDAAARQIDEYFAGERKRFDLPLRMQGTPFQLAVWRALCDIPYGETRCYEQIALAVGNPRAVRAVGMANHRNRLPIVIPCHRVVGKNGKLVGYAGGLDIKEKLIAWERKQK